MTMATSPNSGSAEQPGRPKRGVPEGLWLRCDSCGNTVFRRQVEKQLYLCPDCGHHFYVPSRVRIAQLLDPDSFEEWYDNLRPADPLSFVDSRPYKDRLKAETKRTGLTEACIVGRGYLRGRPLVIGITDSAFIMGSMGSVVGEKLTRAIEEATRLLLPLVIISGSGGGARMHEGILSLMQMAKVSAALGRYHEVGGLFISVLTNPTMGGVAASFASLGDIIIAEPKALIGFAGPRVVEATVKVALPVGFQTSEFLLEHGFVDRIVARPQLQIELSKLIDYCVR
ncbi:MAG: acetyl-CoA carboxylase, carboxyltransferase subunit beta [Planctomycetaceae bacterium]|nr:acetyl-CoA carboxylase, carboxyltransferase subunit beta [Planctomycetaceae bacterium]